MTPIDFDLLFQQYAGRFVEKNRKKFKNTDQIEAIMPDLHQKWCSTPKDYLDQKSPRQYFEGYQNPDELVALMHSYLAFDITPPDLLIERLVDLPDAESAILPLIWDGDPQMAILAMEMLVELDSRLPMADYIHMILNNMRPEEVLDVASESLQTMAESAREPVLAAMDQTALEAVHMRLVDVLIRADKDERIFNWLVRLFSSSITGKALYAAYLADYGDVRAIRTLKVALEIPHLSYLDYIEIVHAIEALGEEAEATRDFTGDPAYRALCNVEGGEG